MDKDDKIFFTFIVGLFIIFLVGVSWAMMKHYGKMELAEAYCKSKGYEFVTNRGGWYCADDQDRLLRIPKRATKDY